MDLKTTCWAFENNWYNYSLEEHEQRTRIPHWNDNLSFFFGRASRVHLRAWTSKYIGEITWAPHNWATLFFNLLLHAALRESRNHHPKPSPFLEVDQRTARTSEERRLSKLQQGEQKKDPKPCSPCWCRRSLLLHSLEKEKKKWSTTDRHPVVVE